LDASAIAGITRPTISPPSGVQTSPLDIFSTPVLGVEYETGSTGFLTSAKVIGPGHHRYTYDLSRQYGPEEYMLFGLSTHEAFNNLVGPVTPPAANPTFDLSVDFRFYKVTDTRYFPIPEPRGAVMALLALAALARGYAFGKSLDFS
jgi:hypothetical protein